MDGITKMIKSCIPLGSVKNTTESLINYTLPMEETSKFPYMFAELEENKNKLGISSIGLHCTTIEDVYLRYICLIRRFEYFNNISNNWFNVGYK